MTPSPLEARLKDLEPSLSRAQSCVDDHADSGPKARILWHCTDNKPFTTNDLGKLIDAVKALRTALQDERGRAREAGLEEAAQVALDNLCEGDSDLIAAHNECADEIANAIRTLKAQSPPGEAQGWRTPGTVEVCQLCCEEPFLKPNCKGHDSELGHLKCPVRKPLPAPPLPTETEG